MAKLRRRTSGSVPGGGKRGAKPSGSGSRQETAETAAGSQAELGRRHGVSQVAVSKWVADPRWAEAGFSRRGPWTPAEIERQKRWRAEVLRERNDQDADAGGGGAEGGEGGVGGDAFKNNLGRAKTIAQVKLLIEREANLKIDRLIKEREYVRRADSEEAGAMKMRAIKTALQQLPKALRQTLADTVDPSLCESILEGALRAVCMEAFT